MTWLIYFLFILRSRKEKIEKVAEYTLSLEDKVDKGVKHKNENDYSSKWNLT